MKTIVKQLLVILTLSVGLASGWAHAERVRPSGALMLNVYGDYLAHYICTSRFPERRTDFDRLYFSSPLRKIVVPCDGLKCADEKLERDLKLVWENSRRASEEKASRLCEIAEYEKMQRNTERQFAAELQSIPPGTPIE
jgi:hypothetical protein